MWTFLTVLWMFQGCYVEPRFVPEFPVGTVEGFKPVYVSTEQSAIAFLPARPLSHPGKIYLYRNYLLVNEQGAGVHVFDNGDPSDPKPLGFLSVPGNRDLAVRSNVLYVDHLGDLVALEVSDWASPKEISRIRQAHWVTDVPPPGERYFECVDPSRGVVVDWQLTTLTNPKCFR